MPAKLLPGLDFSGWARGELSPKVLAAAALEGERLRLNGEAAIGGDADTLLLLLCAARALGTAVAPAQVANLQLPRERGERARVGAAIRSHPEARPRSLQEFQQLEIQIDEAVMEGLGLPPAERRVIAERCQQFPLSETVMRPRYLWSEDRKQQARRRYARDVRYR